MYTSVALRDTESESEVSHIPKKTLYLPARRRNAKIKKNKMYDTHRRRKFIYLAAVTLTVIIVIIWRLEIRKNNDTSDSGRVENAALRKQKSILLLNWQGEQGSQLSSSNCIVDVVNSTRPEMTVEQYNNYDAVIMNSTAENVLLGTDRITIYSYNNSQFRIFATQKPLQYPQLESFERTHFRDYNMSLSYSLTSDFMWHEYEVVRHNDFDVVAPSVQPEWDPPQQKFNKESIKEFYLNEVTEPSPLALTILDRPCQAPRDELVQRIMQNMDVHVYGECGELKCSSDGQCLKQSNKHRNKTYKFYLAFEEEICVDYISEQFYKALNAHLVPVVFGGANYERFAPPQSYINARDFASVRELTEYLLYLDQNPEEMIKYFTWHETYKIRKSGFSFEKICDFLQNKNRQNSNHSNIVETHESIVNWLKNNKCQQYALSKAWPA